MKIGIIGNYGATNIGDDAILRAILRNLEASKVTIFSAHPEKTKTLFGSKCVPLFPFGLRSAWRYGLRDSYRALKSLDAVILGGGGLFQDNYLAACFLWAWQLFWVKRLKKPLFIYGVGVGPLKTKVGRWLTRKACERAEVITVRDQRSAEALQEAGLESEIHVTADPVFDFKKPNFAKGRTKNLFIISLRPWLHYNETILKVFGDWLSHLKEEKGAEFIFVSMQQIRQHDLQMIKPLVRRLGGEIYLPTNFNDLLQVMETAEFAVGMRYHFMIAALLTETPLIPISYESKTEALFEDSPLKEYMSDVETLSEEKLKKDLRKLSASYNNAIVYEQSLRKRYASSSERTRHLLRAFLKRFDELQKD